MNNIIAWLRRNCDETETYDEDYFYGTYHGHRVRYNSKPNILEVGNIEFDRWANSSAYECNIKNYSISTQVNIAIIEAKKAGSPAWHDTMSLIGRIFSNK